MTGEQYRKILVEKIKVRAQMMYDMAEDIAGKTDHISDLSVTISFDQSEPSIPELTITRSHLPTMEQIEHLNDITYGAKLEITKEKLKSINLKEWASDENNR